MLLSSGLLFDVGELVSKEIQKRKQAINVWGKHASEPRVGPSSSLIKANIRLSFGFGFDETGKVSTTRAILEVSLIAINKRIASQMMVSIS
jgi:hypothetical protein